MSHVFNVLTVLCTLLTAIMYWVGLQNFYFFYYPWYDIPVHMVGGLAVGLWGCALAARRDFTPFQTLIFSLLIVLAVGCIWEIFEYVSGLSREPGFWFDTIKDMLNDILGTLVAVVFYWRFYRYIKNKENVRAI